jgi:ketosteroid isomerase-like protein
LRSLAGFTPPKEVSAELGADPPVFVGCDSGGEAGRPRLAVERRSGILNRCPRSPRPPTCLVELAGRQLEAANRHDLDAFMSVFSPDAVYDASREGLGVYEGPAAIRGLIGGWWDAFDDLRLTPEEILDLGNGVLFAAIHHDARPVGSAAHIDTQQAYVFVFAEGLVARTTVYRDMDEARAAAERLAEERG